MAYSHISDKDINTINKTENDKYLKSGCYWKFKWVQSLLVYTFQKTKFVDFINKNAVNYF